MKKYTASTQNSRAMAKSWRDLLYLFMFHNYRRQSYTYYVTFSCLSVGDLCRWRNSLPKELYYPDIISN